jgi:predicted esterase
MKARRVGRAAGLAVVVVLMGSVLSGCLSSQVGPPSDPGLLRYRDQVFPTYTKTADLQYGSAPDLANQPVALRLDLYQPAGDTVTQRPALVWVHGGGFSGGDKGDEGGQVEQFVKRGYVVVSINYRLLSGGCTGTNLTPECQNAALAGINDGQAAVRWLRANASTYRIDSGRIAIGGFSAGAIIATGVGVLSDQPGSSGNPGFSSKVSAWVSVSGGLPGGQSVDAGDSPGYLFSGTADTTVPYQWSVDTAHALDQAGFATVLYTEQGVGHSFPDMGVFATQTSNYFYWLLDLTHAMR